MRLNIFNYSKAGAFNKKISLVRYKRVLENALTDFSGEVNVIFVDQKEMQRLNREYRKLDMSTDVLSFECCEKDKQMLGEVYICPLYIKKRLREEKVLLLLEEEISRMIVHGILHIMGWEHKGYFKYNSTGENLEEMFILQERIVKQICFA